MAIKQLRLCCIVRSTFSNFDHITRRNGKVFTAVCILQCVGNANVIGGLNESYFNPNAATNPGNVQIPQMPSPFIPGSMEYINHHRELQNWDLISYVYFNAPTIVPIFPASFKADAKASSVYGALAGTTQGKSKDLSYRINATRYLTGMNSDQRKLVAENITSVKENRKKITLDTLLVAKYTAHSEKFMLAIAEEPQRLDAKYLRDAITGKKDRKDLNEFATTRSNKQLEELQRVSTKEENLYQELVLKIFRGERDEYNFYEQKQPFSKYTLKPVPLYQPNPEKVEEDVDNLVNTRLSQTYSNILGERSYAHIRAVMARLALKKSITLETLIRERFKDDYQELLLTICQVASNMSKYFAERFHKAMNSGVRSLRNGGLDDDDFIRYLASRSQVDLADIKSVYEKTYGVTLLQDACKEGEIRGHPEYKDGVIALLIGNYPENGYEKGGYENHPALPLKCKQK
ncbi:annexin domain-containing protein [Ditylenchus destructor]|uniref:Annexin domain-containing protein n=1 Tax=Ditylenchus destructor TaxID=166010 RepID=A0AAD4N4X9_9BILA|nr:annexin domain-containing protein [Ditylenchus destructor]